MKFQLTASFRSDYSALSERERALFKDCVRLINEAYARHVESKRTGRVVWPKALRIKPVEDARGVWEVTWSFSGPDGRATFEYVRIDCELGIRWRRIGRHDVFERP